MRLRTDRTRAFAATLISALYLGATMLGFAHLIAQRHAVCAEHGTLHHVARDTSDVRLSPTPGVSPHGWSEDEHCALLHFFQQTSLTFPAPAAMQLVEITADDLAIWQPVEAHLASTDRWRLAPKQSPPSAV